MTNSDSEPELAFTAKAVFPEAEAIFSWQAQPVDAIKDSCLVVLDTSVLLLPYEIGPDALPSIEDAFRALANSGRLRLPGQVAREFARIRPSKIIELFQQINNKKSRIKKPEGSNYPLLEGVEEYKAVIKLEQDLRRIIAEYQRSLTIVADRVRSWEWNDPISNLYNDIFAPETVIDPKFDQANILKDMEFRHQHRLPPGYKDAGKDRNAAGDFIIWNTILHIGKEEQRDMLLVTADRKSDWWHRSGNEGLYPRFELVEEYRRMSSGRTFHATTLSKLLDLVGTNDQIVEEVRQEEVDSEGKLTLSMLANDWPLIIYNVNEINRRTATLLEQAWPSSVDDQVIEIDANYPFHRKRLRDVDVRQLIEDVLESHYGRPLHIRVVMHNEDVQRASQEPEVPF